MDPSAKALADKYGISEGDFAALSAILSKRGTSRFLDDTSAASVDGATGPKRDAWTRYEDLGMLGTGAMGEVRKVRDRDLNRIMAMKIIRTRLLTKRRVLARFVEEAQATAQLTHPGIVPVHELGRLPDGRLYFTMQVVTGRTMRALLRELHAASGGGRWGRTEEGLTLRRLMDLFRQSCDAVAYAHARGVVHRDLKPENIMVGSFGEVLVLDWGLAKIWGQSLPALPSTQEEPVVTNRSGRSALATQHGTVAGTPAYMPPEQARGEFGTLDPRSDVYALGSTLYEILAGRPPFDGRDAQQVLRDVLAGPPAPPGEIQKTQTVTMTLHRDDRGGADPDVRPRIPEALAGIVSKAMERDPTDRFAHAGEISTAVGAWLEGAQKRSEAKRITRSARDLLPEVDRARRAAAELRVAARRLLDRLPAQADPQLKEPAWALEDQAAKLDREAALQDTEVRQLLLGALGHDSDLVEAHRLLAEIYRDEHRTAESDRDAQAAARWEVLLRAHDTGKHARYLAGDGQLSLATDPPSARVWLEQYHPLHRRLSTTPVCSIGRTPLSRTEISHGSYRLRIQAEECVEVFMPVRIGRQAHEDMTAPGGEGPVLFRLPRLGELGEDECLIAPGWFIRGGDAKAVRPRPRERVWLGAFVMQRDPVTHAEYAAFLHADPSHAAHIPHGPGGVPLYETSPPEEWRSQPVSGVSWVSANAYAAWLARETGADWRLPSEDEWEKASRGVDGRFHPWGDHFDSGFAAVRDAFDQRPHPVSIDAFPFDVSPYGVRGMAGNTADWCSDVYRGDGANAPRVIRGGHFDGASPEARCASRAFDVPDRALLHVGFRLVRSTTVPRAASRRRSFIDKKTP
ncbi:MAG: SUMF1/EgtB/PvdO family nonheme iron enzyme [Proteobacteria bacterium]|nr:SUMF1/EgtB/PvdO family nonheme iron enzyme [Pseudomonadota bacterium]